MQVWLVVALTVILAVVALAVVAAASAFRASEARPIAYEWPASPRVYVHVCTMGPWVPVVRRLLDELGQHLPHARVNVVGVGLETERLARIVHGCRAMLPHCRMRHAQDDMSQYERTTLGCMWDDVASNEEQYPVLYLHSKGVSKTNPTMASRVADWVDFMLEHLVTGSKTALAQLSECDVVGTNFKRRPQPHFSGNFWWATSAHLRTLPRTVGPKYLDPEMWVCSAARSCVCLARSRTMHYKYRTSRRDVDTRMLLHHN
jgi:hypothetical protein